MFCIHCGEKILDDNKFCTACGKPIDKVNPKEEPSTKDSSFDISDNKILQFASKTEDFLSGKILPTIKRTSKSAIDKGRELTSDMSQKVREDVLPKTKSFIDEQKEKQRQREEVEREYINQNMKGTESIFQGNSEKGFSRHETEYHGLVDATNAERYEGMASGIWGIKNKLVIYVIWLYPIVLSLILYFFIDLITPSYYIASYNKLIAIFAVATLIQTGLDIVLHNMGFNSSLKTIEETDATVKDRLFNDFVKDKIIYTTIAGLRVVWLVTVALLLPFAESLPNEYIEIITAVIMLIITSISMKIILMRMLKPMDLDPILKNRFSGIYTANYMLATVGISLIFAIILIFMLSNSSI